MSSELTTNTNAAHDSPHPPDMLAAIQRLIDEMPDLPPPTEIILSPDVWKRLNFSCDRVSCNLRMFAGMCVHIVRTYAEAVVIATELHRRGVKIVMHGSWPDNPTPTEGRDSDE